MGAAARMPRKRAKAQARKRRILHHLDVDDLAGNEKPHVQEGKQTPEESHGRFALGAMNASNLETSIAIRIGTGGKNSDTSIRPNEKLSYPEPLPQ